MDVSNSTVDTPEARAILHRILWKYSQAQSEKPGMVELMQAARNNAIVAAFLQNWRMGNFDSWEKCLVSLVVALTEQNERLVSHAVDLVQKSCPAYSLPFYPCCEGAIRLQTDPNDQTTLVAGFCSIHGLSRVKEK